MGFLVQQVSLATGQLAASVASVSVCNPIVSIIIGIVVLQETLADPLWHKVVAFAGLGVGLIAAILITRSTEDPDGAPVTAPSGLQGTGEQRKP